MANSLDPDSQNIPTPNGETVLSILSLAANAASTTILFAPQALNYVVYAYIVCTQSGVSDTVPSFSISYTDDSGANSINLNAPASPTSGSHASTVTNFYATNGSAVAYSVSGGVYSNGSQYALRLIARIV